MLTIMVHAVTSERETVKEVELNTDCSFCFKTFRVCYLSSENKVRGAHFKRLDFTSQLRVREREFESGGGQFKKEFF